LPVAVLAAGCLTEAQQFGGSGPITLSPEVTRAFEWHKHLGGYLVVSSDGGHFGESYCATKDCTDVGVLDALFKCRALTTSDCRLFAKDGVVVWDGPWRTAE